MKRKYKSKELELLADIYNAHRTGNNGAYMGEAVLCPWFADRAKEILDAASEDCIADAVGGTAMDKPEILAIQAITLDEERAHDVRELLAINDNYILLAVSTAAHGGLLGIANYRHWSATLHALAAILDSGKKADVNQSPEAKQ